MHQDARPSSATSSSQLRAEGAGPARADSRQRTGRRGRANETPADATTGGIPERRPDQPALPAPIGDPGEGGRGGGRAAEAAARTPTDELYPMRVIEILSHELRSPITTIHLGTKVLREQGNRISQPIRIEVVEAVEEEAERLYRLVEDLLAVARHEGGAAPLPVGPIALQHWLAPVVSAEVQASPTLRVRASIPPDLPAVMADDAALAHVVRNLLANVTRYAPDGMPAEIVAWLNDEGSVRLEVLDRGPGVQPEEAATLFEPFYRTSAAVAIGSGAGLGLAAAERLMRAMNGTIVALPRTGGGARFVLTLPVAAADADLEDDLPPRAVAGDAEPDARPAAT